MEESFDLQVVYKGKEVTYQGKLLTMGYTFKIYVSVNGQEIIFEPDEERNLRAIVEHTNSGLPHDLVRIIGEALEQSLR